MGVLKNKPPKDKEKKIILLLGKGVPQRITQPENLLKIDDIFYRSKIKPELNKLGQNPTEMQKVKTIFNLIKAKGKLGIEYNISEKMPKTPDQVLKNKKGDCDELSLTFLAVAEKAGISIKNFNLFVITFEVETPFGAKKESRHAAVLNLKSDESDNKTYLLDLAIPEVGFVELKRGMDSLNDVYLNKEVMGGKITGVKSYNVKEGKNKILSTFYEEGADYYRNGDKPFFAIKYYEKAVKINPNNKTLREKISTNYIYTARNKTNDENEQEKYFRKAVEYSSESVEANFWLGSFLVKQKKYKKAIMFLEKAIEVDSEHLKARANLAHCLYSLGPYTEVLYKEAEEQCLKVIEIADKELETTPNNLAILEPLCKANLILSAIYQRRGKLEKARECNSKALEYSKRGLETAKNKKIFFELNKTALRNSKALH